MFYSVLGLQKIEHVIQGMPNHAPHPSFADY